MTAKPQGGSIFRPGCGIVVSKEPTYTGTASISDFNENDWIYIFALLLCADLQEDAFTWKGNFLHMLGMFVV